jgi:NADH-quinone oxidoreductase subunit E
MDAMTSARASGWDVPADLEKPPATVPDPATTDVPEDLRKEIEARMALYPDSRSATLPALEAAQRVHGWCSPEAIEQVACVMGLTPAYLDAVATFYDMLETEPVGRHSIYVCTNISCSLCGADELYEGVRDAAAGEPEEFNVRAFECLGACDIAPMASVDGVYVGPLTLADVPQLLDDTRAGRDVLPEKQLARRRVADPHANSQEFPAHPGQPEESRTLPGQPGTKPPGGPSAASAPLTDSAAADASPANTQLGDTAAADASAVDGKQAR